MMSHFYLNLSIRAFLVSLCIVFVFWFPPVASLEVLTPSGPINGFQQNGANLFLGIPFALPPVDNLRWKPPHLFPPWNNTFEAYSFGPGCIQDCFLPLGSCPESISEDCLTLNVYTPSTATPASNLAVMFFIHGGNFRVGTGGCPIFNAALWSATEGHIVVTTNYRLGAFGFFFNEHTTANLGLLDQQAALEWTRRNIASFGGNPERISIFGESAGATSVASHLQNSRSLSMIVGAIVESVPAGIVLRQPDEVQKLNQKFAELLNCDVNDQTCLMSASSISVLNAQIKASHDYSANHKHIFEMAQAWEPTAGNVSAYILQPAGPSFYIPNPEIQLELVLPHSIPVIFGSLSGEGWLFAYNIFPKQMGPIEFESVVAFVFGLHNVKTINQLYPIIASDEKDYRGVLARILTDYLFTCPVRNFTRSIAASRTSPSDGQVFSFYFDELSPESKEGWGPRYPICWSQVCHGAELFYVFNSAPMLNITFQPDEIELAQLIGHYWANFAKYGTPNENNIIQASPSRVPYWNPISASSPYSVMKLISNQSSIIPDPRVKFCDFWDSVGYSF